MDLNLSFRPITATDKEFLYTVYASTRTEELAQTDWSDQEKETFLRQQFNAQHQFYMDQFAAASFALIMLDAKPVGRLYVDRRPEEIRLIDIALLPSYRNRGIGTHLLKDLLNEAAESRKTITIHVEKFNPALQLYQRLGFRIIDESGVYYLMEWSAEEK